MQKNMDNDDIKKAEKGRSIARHIVRLMRNGRKESESLDAIKDFASENAYAKDLYDRMADESYLKSALEDYRKNSKTDHIESYVGEWRQKRRRRNRVRLLYVVTSAAAAIIFGFFALRNIQLDNKKTFIAGQEDVPAVILESGEAVSLLNSQQQIIIGSTTVEHEEESKIVYPAGTTEEEVVEHHTLVVPSRSMYTVVLSDGTEVTLNAGSRLVYPKKFSGEQRQVVLEGEGYFVVSKSEAPFIVSTKKMDIQVLGTVFNICLNKKDRVEALLLEGSIRVNLKDRKHDDLTMVPGQLFTLNVHTGDYKLQKVDMDDYLGWRKYVFKATKKSLSNLTDQIAAWYGVEFVYDDPAIEKLPVSVIIDMHLEISQVISIIEVLTEHKIEKKGGTAYEIK
jgi:ferric-dicitrate binding protein FerR (iron transport regulator)